MMNKNKSGVMLYLCIIIAGVLFVSSFISCGKEGTNIGTANAKLNIVNLSLDVQPFNLYTHFFKQNSNNYRYPNASGYFLLNIADTPFQIRPAITNGVNQLNLLTLQTPLQQHVNYTWFVTGLRADSSLATVLTVDTGSLPAIGRGKIRFVNASPGSVGLNMTANDTLAFSKVAYKQVTDYIEVTAGSYDLNFTATSAPSTVLKTLKNVPVLDGKLYTIYAYGLTNRTDTAAFGANIILNTLPDKNY
ncbi:DUF4397 domain-containing protein [Mucilaginibacter segetis]|uniref:DUF4397 domain-containing protein n=1 Tax=Mucilaginibacter segetis TaxID=2793071 RepID=A0A934PS30_9SPHI|nr:DUF4397 domain-containing protein [Mucilaginibacter segetis]MBK0378390.1 DUF4397 domain-containing protein [Mucilaginibacter segetis]